MRKIIFSIILLLLLVSLTSAEIIINTQPEEIYNLGDSVSVPIIIRASTDLTGSLELDLLCSGQTTNFYKNGVSLFYGEDLELSPAPSLVLTQDIIENMRGNCKIKIRLTGEEPVLTEEFRISNLLNIYLMEDLQIEFEPGENLIIEGTVVRENGVDADGFIELTMFSDNSTEGVTQLNVINNGFFTINMTLPEDLESKLYLTNLKAYETDFNSQETNIGNLDYNIQIIQVPTNLEILFEQTPIEPGTNLKVKAILHDQSGIKIEETTTIITIKDFENKIVEQLELPTDQFLELPIAYNELPGIWKAVAVSNQLTTESEFNISEKEKIDIKLINKTIEISNVGNVIYCNQTVLVKVGEDSLNINLCLEVDETKKYKITAPDGEYYVEIITNEGNVLSENVMLTGNSVNIKESSKKFLVSSRYYIVWVFVIAILGFIAFTLFRKGYKKSFIGKMHIKKKGTKQNINDSNTEWKKISASALGKKSLINTRNKAKLSLSLKGEKQGASVVCLKIKNLQDIESKKGNKEETLQRLVKFAEESKAMMYENQNHIFFIFAPIRTRTFENERTAIELSRKIKEILKHHNNLYKQKIEFGLSVNYGEIIAKKEDQGLKFMSIGNLIILCKKLSGISNEEVLLSENVINRVGSDIKTHKHNKENFIFHTIKEIIDREKNKKFIANFLTKIEKDKNKK